MSQVMAHLADCTHYHTQGCGFKAHAPTFGGCFMSEAVLQVYPSSLSSLPFSITL